jgi:hypothetical protein
MQLRSDLYKNDPKFVGFLEFTSNDINDYWGKNNRTQLLMKDGRCVGGGRITHRGKGEKHLLPLEIDLIGNTKSRQYHLQNLLPGIDLGDRGCVEVSRMVVMPECRGDVGHIGSMFLNFFVLGLEMDAEYLFAMTDKIRSRMYRQIANVSVRREGIVFNHLELPDRTYFEGVKMQIVGWDKYNRLNDIYVKN